MLTLEAMNRRKFSSSTLSVDVRVFLLLSAHCWLGWTGLTVMALGFVVARFGLFLTLLTAGTGVLKEANSHWLSGALGILLVLIGSIVVIGGLHNHTRYIA
jgi:putative membrane protein